MTTIVTRASKGSPLTFTEADANFTNLKTTVDDHVADTAGAHAASAISNTPAGNIVATDVQAAITELDGQDTTIQTNLNTRTGTSASTGNRNRLHNGDFKIAQRGAGPFTSVSTFVNNDATILLDRWRILTDTNDVIDVSQDTSTLPTAPGARTAIALDVETINKKFGIIQWIENKNCADLIGNTVTVSFKAKVSGVTKLDNIKCAIIAWSSTADAPTADAISAWGVEGTNPTLVANMTYENTPTNLGVTTTYATYSVSGLVDTASCANIGVFIWSDVTDTSLAEFVYITDVQLEAGTVASPFERKMITDEDLNCKRYLHTLGLSSVAATFQLIGYNSAGAGEQFPIIFPTEMLKTPTVTVSGTWAATNCGQPSTSAASTKGYVFVITVTALGLFATGTNTADDGILASAEI